MKWTSPIADLLVVTTLAAAGAFAGCAEDSDTYELAWVSDRGGDGLEIYLTTLDTAYTRNISNAEGNEYSLDWSPDGKHLIFTAMHDDTTGTDLYLMDAEGAAVRNLTASPGSDGGGGWTPDGTKIVFASRRHDPEGPHSQDELYLMNADGSAVRRLTQNENYDAAPSVSPDGSRIAFCREVQSSQEGEGGVGAIFVMNIDGTDEVRLTFQRGFDCLPHWSPDGSRIAFHRCSEGGCKIFVMNADGSELQNLTDDEYDNRWPRWSPDGRYLAYTSVRNEQTDIWIMRPDGTEKRALTTHPGRDEVADWRPR
jgi:TolB protein